MKRKVNKKYLRLFKPFQNFQSIALLIMGFLIVWVVASATYSKVQAFFVQTLTIESTTKDMSIENYGFIHADTSVIKAIQDGEVTFSVHEGERVAKNQKIGIFHINTKDEKKEEEVLAPQAGIFTTNIDGYEMVNNIKDVEKLELKKIYEENKKHTRQKDRRKISVTKDEVYAAIIDNLAPVTLYMLYDPEKNPIFKRVDDIFWMRFPEIGDDVRAYIIDVKPGKNDQYWASINLGPMTDAFLQKRVILAQAYRMEEAVLNLPKTAFVEKNNTIGVYTVSRGFVIWQPITIKKVDEKTVTCDILPKGTVVILTPNRVKEGQIVK